VHIGGFDQVGPGGHVLRLSGTERRRQEGLPERRDPTNPAPPVNRTITR
jgi:hypothetical protein